MSVLVFDAEVMCGHRVQKHLEGHYKISMILGISDISTQRCVLEGIRGHRVGLHAPA